MIFLKIIGKIRRLERKRQNSQFLPNIVIWFSDKIVYTKGKDRKETG